LFIEQLAFLDDKNSPLFSRCTYLLERLCVVKAFIILVDLSDDLVIELFSTLFDAIV